MFFATTATVVIAHAIVSGIANWDRGGDRDVLTPEWWPERQITGLVYFLPFLCLWYATNASWLDLLAYYIIPAALMILTQSPGRGSYGDAATVKRRDNEKLRHLLNLIPGLEEKPDPINSELIIPNPARDAAGLFVLGLIMGLVPAAAMVYAGSWLSALVVLAGFMSMPIWYFADNVWLAKIPNEINEWHISWAEWWHGTAIGLSCSLAAYLAY